MDLREPKKKRVGPHIKPQQQFPIIIESENVIPVGEGLWPIYMGNFTGDSVVVCNPDEMRSLYTMGCYGKGSFSRGYPAFGLAKKGIPPVIKERQWLRRKTWMGKIKENLNNLQKPQDKAESNNMESNLDKVSGENLDKNAESENNESTSVIISNTSYANCKDIENSYIESNQLKRFANLTDSTISDALLVIADSDDEDIEKVIRDPQPHLEDEPIKTAVETLNLMLEEAFFLSYALGCLQVFDMLGQAMTINQMWQTFCRVKDDFIETYVAYHYFRAKGWIVKSGYKFGGDFLLYKQGPAFYHASYVVLVEKVDSQLNRQNNSITWTKLHGLERLAESSGKEIITCWVVFPDKLTAEDLATPKILPRFQVNEQLTRRWISSQEREDKDQS